MIVSAPIRPVDYVEQSLVRSILFREFPPGTKLPGERKLSAQLGVTRPTLREALCRMERDGWLDVKQGKSTQVNDFWRDGGMSILDTVIKTKPDRTSDYVLEFILIFSAIAPLYISKAIGRRPSQAVELLSDTQELEDTSETYSSFDWILHRRLVINSGLTIMTFMLNEFNGIYSRLISVLYDIPDARRKANDFYKRLYTLAKGGDASETESIVRTVYQDQIKIWKTNCRGKKKNYLPTPNS